MTTCAATNRWHSPFTGLAGIANVLFPYLVGTSSNLVVRVGALTTWQVEAIKKVLSYRTLPNNWDSYGSGPVTDEAIMAAVSLLDMIPSVRPIAPRSVPVSGGGVQFEWSHGPKELEVEIRPNGSLELLRVEHGMPVNEGQNIALTEADIRDAFTWLNA
jgi:hypothetical protein